MNDVKLKFRELGHAGSNPEINFLMLSFNEPNA